ncbi:MAG: prepilin-type N-terminal cleavage/methylation domain-containing protein [Planctomycetota bacterium]
MALSRRGLSLLELMVVLVILVAIALLALPSLSNIRITTPTGETKTPTEVATQATMNSVRQAIAGDEGIIETMSHKSNALPRKIDDLVKSEPPAHIVEEAPELVAYDPIARIGWRGPYVAATGQNDEGKPTVVDGWGNELEIQIDFDKDGTVDPTESKYIRVVSAGPNGEIDTPDDVENMKPGENSSSELTLSECGDDVVMFLRYPDYRR